MPWGKKKGKTKTDSQPTFSAEGETASNDGKQLVIHTKDGREIVVESLLVAVQFLRFASHVLVCNV